MNEFIAFTFVMSCIIASLLVVGLIFWIAIIIICEFFSETKLGAWVELNVLDDSIKHNTFKGLLKRIII